jgi:hypothetical protein
MTDRELMQQALEAAPLSDYSKADGDFYKWWYSHMQNDLMQPPLNEVGYRVARYIWDAALRERLAQPEQEPVTWEDVLGAIARGWTHEDNKHKPMDVPLAVAIAKEVQDMVAAPPRREWVGLTRDEVLDIEETHPLAFYRAIEAKLKEKNNG